MPTQKELDFYEATMESYDWTDEMDSVGRLFDDNEYIIMADKRYITTEEYNDFIAALVERYEGYIVNIVTNWRGGLPMAVHLNNVLKYSTLSLLKYQSRDGCDSFPWELHMDDFRENADVTLFIDDIYATGKSSQACIQWLRDNQDMNHDIEEMYLVSRDRCVDGFIQTDKTDDEEWMIFPWERVEESKLFPMDDTNDE